VLVARCWQWNGLAQQICFQFRKPKSRKGRWEVWAFPALQEILGGRHDGETGWAGFDFDVSHLLTQLRAGTIGLSTATRRHPSELIFEGMFRNRPVRLHLCLEPAEGVEVTEVIDLLRPGEPTVREKD
jgi:hypothetical protein